MQGAEKMLNTWRNSRIYRGYEETEALVSSLYQVAYLSP